MKDVVKSMAATTLVSGRRAMVQKQDPTMKKLTELLLSATANVAAGAEEKRFTFWKELEEVSEVWPNFDSIDQYEAHVKQVHQEITDDKRRLGKFFSRLDQKMLGLSAVQRLCDEFIFVHTHCVTRDVSQEELTNCTISVDGRTVYAHSDEELLKLVHHRLKNGDDFRRVFVARFKFLLEHAVEVAGSTAIQHGHKAGRVEREMKRFKKHAEATVQLAMKTLERRMNEMMPWDRTSLNPRIAVAQVPMRAAAYDFHTGAKRSDADVWDSLEVAGYNAVNDRESKNYGHMRYEVLTCGEDLLPNVNEIMHRCEKRHTEDPANAPYSQESAQEDLADTEFHELALLLHRTVMVDATFHCRPYIIKMFSDLVNGRKLRKALDATIDQTKFNKMRAKKQEKIDGMRQTISDMRQTVKLSEEEEQQIDEDVKKQCGAGR